MMDRIDIMIERELQDSDIDVIWEASDIVIIKVKSFNDCDIAFESFMDYLFNNSKVNKTLDNKGIIEYFFIDHFNIFLVDNYN